ncbi:MAG: hypothetical protein AAB664_00985 [Patescibacteria group bacterium]
MLHAIARNQKGAAGLIVMMILLAITSLIIGGFMFFGVDDLETGYAKWRSDESILSAESCAEEALLRVKRNASYTGGTLNVGNSTCTIAIVGSPCGTCTVNVSSVTGPYTRRLQTTMTKSGSLMTLSTWQEVD